MNPNESQVGGSHYKAGLQHWDYTIRALANRYLEGNITKYVTRYKKKNGIQDLEKAIHYLDKLATEYEAGVVPPLLGAVRERYPVVKFYDENDLDSSQRLVLDLVGNWQNRADLSRANEVLHQMLQRAKREAARLEAIKAGAEPMPKGYVDQD